MSQPTFDAPAPEALGEMLPAYDFESLIAVGGMGAVYKAKQRSLDRDVAVKILPRELSEDPEFRASFETEARAMARLNHPNLIGVYDFGTVGGMLYIVMEYVAGKPLYYSSYGIQVDPAQAVQLVQGICAGLGHAHENGIIHRDIKPANILLTPRAEPKIGDFGLAHPTDGTGPGLAMGTPGYTAPEVLQNPHHADHRSDIFAVGVILYELLTGKPQEHGAEPPSRHAKVDATMDSIWKRATHPDPAQRFQDTAAFSAALGGWLQHHRTTPLATPPATSRLPAAGGRPSPRPSAVLPERTNWPLARNLLIIAALVVVIVVVWSNLQSKKTAVERENAELIAKRQAERKARIEEETLRMQERPRREAGQNGSLPNDNGQPTDPTASRGESPSESLQRLRRMLALGSREEMPVTSVRRGAHHFLLVEQPMTWSEAAAFAEEHGGHLAVPTSVDDLNWIAQQIPEDTALWIGAGRSGRELWSMLDGTTWSFTNAPRGTGSHAAVNALGVVRATEGTEALPFLIQWHNDGTNPGTLDASLRATAASLDQPAPVFPPGTVATDGRHFLHISRAASWHEATRHAETAGGHLAVPATPRESEFIARLLEKAEAPRGVWLGGIQRGGTWTWVTGEPWEHAAWAPDANSEGFSAALLHIPGKGWDAAEPSADASGWIIEWSAEGAVAGRGDDEEETAELDPAIIELTNRAKTLVATAGKKRDDDLAKNAKAFAWDMDVWHRGLNRSEQQSWQRPIQQLKNLVQNNRVPEETPKRISLSPQLAKILDYSAQKQKQIDAAFTTDIERLRVAYIAKIEEAAKEAEAAGNAASAKSLKKLAASSADVAEWLEHLGTPSPTTATSREEPAAESIVGRWVWGGNEIVTFNSDSTGKNLSNGFDAAWKLISSSGGRQNYILEWKGGRWIDDVTLDEAEGSLKGTSRHGGLVRGLKIETGADPLIGAWKWREPNIGVFRENGVVLLGEEIGRWSPVSGKTGHYNLRWPTGTEATIELAKDFSEFTLTNNYGEEFIGRRPER